MTYEIVKGDARALPLPPESVDLVVTSPPYFGLRSYKDNGEHYDRQIGAEPTPAEFVEALLEATDEATRVLKPGGSLWVNLGDKYVADNRGSGRDRKRGKAKWAPEGPGGYPGEGVMPKGSLMGLPWRFANACVDELDLILRAEIVWAKPNGMPESVTDRVRRSHETWFHFTPRRRYYANIDRIREPHTSGEHGATRNARTDRRADEAERFVSGTTRGLAPQPGDAGAFHPLGKLPGSVRTVSTRPLRVPPEMGIKHFAAFPVDWPAWIIAGWCPPGGTVLDPFGGSGTTALVADVMGCHGITVDLSSDYCRLAEWRITDPRQRELAAAGVARALPKTDTSR